MRIKQAMNWKLAGVSAMALALAAGTAPQAEATLLTNGDFETGDFTGWINSGTASSIDSTTPLAGSHSLAQTASGGSSFTQLFDAQTVETTASFIFTASDPGGDGDRSMNVYFQGSGSTDRINLRLVDLLDDGDGDVQVFNGAWTTVLTDAVTFGEVTNFSLTFNAYGVGANYDITVGTSTATGLTGFQGSAPTDFGRIEFVASSNAAGSAFEVDNVVVSAVPEPGSLALLGLGGLLIARRRRNA